MSSRKTRNSTSASTQSAKPVKPKAKKIRNRQETAKEKRFQASIDDLFDIAAEDRVQVSALFVCLQLNLA